METRFSVRDGQSYVDVSVPDGPVEFESPDRIAFSQNTSTNRKGVSPAGAKA